MADIPTQSATRTNNPKPVLRPGDPRFSCGPVKKYPGWSWDAIADAPLSRTHRAGAPVARIKEAIERTHALLELPEGYKVALLPGSDTGAMEAAMWSLLGQRGTDVFSWDVFGNRWTLDARDELKLQDLRVFQTPAGTLPDISQYDGKRDAIFTLNGTAAGVWIPDFDWIDADREGLTLCDATSAAFAVEIDWSKIDVLTFSWQKCMGGEAQHGMLVMSPRAIERLDNYRPDWPIPGLLQLHTKGKANLAVYEGSTLNTPSLMAVEDYLAALKWASRIGGLPELIRRREENFAALDAWVQEADWIDYLCANPAHRSPVSVTLKYTDPAVIAAGEDAQWDLTKKISSLLERENAALDISMHRASVPGIRIWCGPTVERDDLAALGPWLDWAYREALDAG
ncbi:phosphoserine transaminase [Maricaulis maris]|uniref:phosphoserine transaminase n=1 Tax=Maricaulis maris TaxID=74318 RepID=A0A495DLX5_9PROT|nr:phosphoserine transaminase [Maricaulis maris]RKR03923.1 phosphoserine aminotransferase [Maricaulis maris]